LNGKTGSHDDLDNPLTAPTRDQRGLAGEHAIKNLFLLIACGWTLLVAMLVTLNYRHFSTTYLEIALSSARDTFSRDLVYRRWATAHGGVYVPISPETPPNPYLAYIPERDIVTPSGKALTLVNPAYMTRQVHELGFKQYGLRGHITSLKSLRPENAPDPWERDALQAFERGVKEVAVLEPISDKTYFRFMRPMLTEEGCMKCHAKQGYVVGDIRGGISVSVPWHASRLGLRAHLYTTMLAFGSIWLVGLVGAWGAQRKLLRHLAERRQSAESLQKAFDQIKTLRGIIPICAKCKKIRDDQGYWNQVETYVHDHTEAEFSHGICPDCMKKLYPHSDPEDGNASGNDGGTQ